MVDKIKIVLADDHPMLRAGVAQTLSEQPDIEIVGEGADAEQAVSLAERLLPDVILLDISMPGGGIEAARRIGAAFPVVKIVMLTVSENDDDVCSALNAGARGYVLKGIGAKELVDVVRTVHAGGSYVSPALAARILADVGIHRGRPPVDRNAELSAREEQILERVARGMSNKEIGRELDIQEKTVKHYMTNILQKLQVRNRVEAALKARELFADRTGAAPDGRTKV